MKQAKIINKNIIFLVPMVFLLVIGIKIFFLYQDVDKKMLNYVKKEASVLNDYFMSNRLYYQNLFIDKVLPLDEKTLKALPAFSAYPISKRFFEVNNLGVKIQTVSDRARNPKNMVDKDELKAIKFFNLHKNKKMYINKEKDYYQFATPLFVEPVCLKCHGKKEDAPKLIQTRYLNSYNYKLGDLRGLVSIKIPIKSAKEYFYKDFKTSLFYDIILFLVLFIFVYYLLYKSKQLSNHLNNQVQEKTAQLKEQNNYLQSYIKALDTSLALVRTDVYGNITYVNDKFLKDTGFTKDEVIGKTPSIIKHPSTKKALIKNMWDTILQKKIWTGIVKGVGKNQNEFINKVYIIPVLDENGEIKEFIAPRADITDIIKGKEKLKNMLATDSLTKLPNRIKLIDDINKACKIKTKHLALLNIDSFKNINDFYGHHIGDKVLVLMAKELFNGIKNKNCKLYKMPSDEYAIFSTEQLTKEQFNKYITMLLCDFENKKLYINDIEIFISFSCGVASNENDLIIKADMALQKAKNDNQNIIIYDETINTSQSITDNIIQLKLLKNAIKNDNIVPFFQPIYDLKTKKITKYECLARIVTQNNKVLTPYHFLDIAIKSKLYNNITKSIITKSFEYFKDKEFEFSINLSNEDITNETTKTFIMEKLKEFPNPHLIVFEILESERINNYSEIQKFIDEVKKIGPKVAIDDFGSGYSNFSHILELNINYLKIDASLVKYIIMDKNSRLIVETIISFAKHLGLKTIAEFVEDKQSLDMLENMGCDYIQGYYIGKPQRKI